MPGGSTSYLRPILPPQVWMALVLAPWGCHGFKQQKFHLSGKVDTGSVVTGPSPVLPSSLLPVVGLLSRLSKGVMGAASAEKWLHFLQRHGTLGRAGRPSHSERREGMRSQGHPSRSGLRICRTGKPHAAAVLTM